MANVLPPLEAYDRWSATWDEDPSAIVALESVWLSQWLGPAPGPVAVDAGCGTGRWLSVLRDRGARAVGFDVSAGMLAKAAEKPGLAGRMARADLMHIPVASHCADLVLCALSLGHAADPVAAFCELARVVKPGGCVMMSDFHPGAYARGWRRTFRSGGKTHEVQHSPYAAADLLAADRGLVLEEIAEPGFDERQRELFVRAGKPELFDQVRGRPAILLMRWRRPCD